MVTVDSTQDETVSRVENGIVSSTHSGHHLGAVREDDPSPSANRSAGFVGSTANLANTIIGILAMPKAFVSTGLLFGIVSILLSASASALGLYFLARCASRIERGHASFFEAAKRTYPGAAVLFDTAICFKCFGVGVSYLIIIGDLAPQVASSMYPGAIRVTYLMSRHFWITLSMIIITPLSFLRRLNSLKYVSVVALAAIGYLVAIVVSHFLFPDHALPKGEIRYLEWGGPVRFLSTLPIFIFGFTCHQNMFTVVNEIRDNSKKSISAVIAGAVGTSAMIYLVVSICGYLTFGSVVQGNIISMYQRSVASTVGRTAIVILILFSYPLQCHPCRASINNVINSFYPEKTREEDGRIRISDFRFSVLTTTIIFLSYSVAMAVGSLDRVLSYVGATGSTSISFILPGLFYWKIKDTESTRDSVEQRARLIDSEGGHPRQGEQVLGGGDGQGGLVLKRAAISLVAYGALVMSVCLVLNMIRDISS